MIITGYNALCNLGNSIDEIYTKAIDGDISNFDYLDCYLKNKLVRGGLIKANLPKIYDEDFNTRCNRLLLKNLELLNNEISALLDKYPKEKIGITVATTNSGVNEFEISGNKSHFAFATPSVFLKNKLNLKGFHTTVSTACSSGIKAFSIAGDLFRNNILDAIIIASVDSFSKVPIYGFHSLGVLSDMPSVPFSKNRCGMNIGEASSIFIVEKNSKKGVKVYGIGENSDIYHTTTPDPNAKEAINAIKMALNNANMKYSDIDYINIHGTGTIANDIMEAKAIYEIFKDEVPISSTKPMTGHCLGAAAGIEIALCLKLIENFNGSLYPHIYDNCYDESLPKVNLAQKNKIYKKCDICMCNSFGFGGTNAIMIMGKNNE